MDKHKHEYNTSIDKSLAYEKLITFLICMWKFMQVKLIYLVSLWTFQSYACCFNVLKCMTVLSNCELNSIHSLLEIKVRSYLWGNTLERY